MQMVMEVETRLGNDPRDVSDKKCGYDIESKVADGKLRFIEVKGRVVAPSNAIPLLGTKPAQKGWLSHCVFMHLYARDKKPISCAIGSKRHQGISPLMTPHSDPPYDLEISRADLLHAVEIVGGLMGKQPSGVSLQFEDGWLWIESDAGIAKTPARGTWPQTIIAGRSWVRRLAKNMPAGNPVRLRVEEGRLYANRYSEPCTRTAVKQPINAKAPHSDTILEAARILKPLLITKWDLAAMVVEAGREGRLRGPRKTRRC